MKTKSAIQHRLDFQKAARVGRYVFNRIDRWASYEGSHSLGRMLISSEILENQICDPESAGFFEGRQIWEVRFERICSEGFKRSLHSLGRIFILGRSFKTKSVIQRRLDFFGAVRFGRYV